MTNFQNKIQKNYNKIVELDILNNITDESLKQFEKYLNYCLPRTQDENSIYYFIKQLFFKDKEKFYTYIQDINNTSLVLITDNKTMMEHFGLTNKIFIGWNNTHKTYYVSRYIIKVEEPLLQRPDTSKSTESLISLEELSKSTSTNNMDSILYDIVDIIGEKTIL